MNTIADAGDRLSAQDIVGVPASFSGLAGALPLEVLFDAMPDFGFLKDPDGRYVRVNLSLCRLHGKQRSEILGRTDHELFPAEIADAFVATDQELKRSGEAVRENARFVLPGGEVLAVESLKIPLFDVAGAFVGVLGIARDVSERVRQAEALDAARLAAESAAQAKAQFLANMSHEIRTPLNGIIGLAHVLLGDELSVQQRERVDKLLSTSRLLLGQLNDLLDLSKIDAGKMALSETGFSPGELLGRLSDAFSGRFLAKGLALQLYCSGPLASRRLVADALRIEQVLTNFVGNSLKFTEAGEVTLTVSERHAPDAGVSNRSRLRFEVKDTGVGIPAKLQPQLFHPFEQGDASTTRRFGGSGLGLAICKGLAELLGGEVGMTSSPGNGSIFWLEVPVGEASETPISLPGEAPVSLAGLHILLVEDNELSREVGQLLLGRAGALVSVVCDGVEAVEAVAASLRGERYDCVLMDMQMPRMGGVEATRSIREFPGADELPILAMTANATTVDRQACLAAGMDAFIGKPFEPLAMFAKIRETVSAGRSDLGLPLRELDHAQ